MALYQLKRKQILPISLQQAWEFFSSPFNLAKITPPDMGFQVKLVRPEDKMYPGIEVILRNSSTACHSPTAKGCSINSICIFSSSGR
jgi:hypothetical protein